MLTLKKKTTRNVCNARRFVIRPLNGCRKDTCPKTLLIYYMFKSFKSGYDEDAKLTENRSSGKR